MRFQGLAAHADDVPQVGRAHFPKCFQFLGDPAIVDRELRRGRELPLIPVRRLRQVAALHGFGDSISAEPLGRVEKQVLPILDGALRHGDLGALGGAAPGCVAFVECHRPVKSGEGSLEQAVVEIEERVAGAIVDERLDLAAAVAAEITDCAAVQ